MQKKHLILALLVTAAWGINFPITKLGLAHINPLLLTALRFALAALPWVFFVRRPAVALRWLLAYGLIFGVAMWALINLGIAMGVPPGNAALLIQLSAFFTLGWGVLLFHESLSRPQWLGSLLAALGLACLLLGSPGTAATTGFILILISALAWSVGNILIKLSGVREIFSFVVWASLVPPLPLLLLTWCLYGTAPFTQLAAQANATALFSLAFQVYAATLFCYWGWNLLLREYPVSKVAPLSLLIPVFGLLSSAVILHQLPKRWDWLAIALVLAALAIGMRKRPAVHSHRPAAQGQGSPCTESSAG